MKTGLVASLIVNVILLIGIGLLVSMHSQRLDTASHEAAKWKQEAVRLYRVRAEEMESLADTLNSIAKGLPDICKAPFFIDLEAGNLRHFGIRLHATAIKVTARLNEGDPKEPLDEASWQEK